MIVLVTGATAGFGECITRRFIQQGHKVIATGRRQERLQELKDELGDNLYIAQLDVRNRAAIEEMLASLPAEWCNIDILVNNAGLAFVCGKFLIIMAWGWRYFTVISSPVIQKAAVHGWAILLSNQRLIKHIR